MKFSQACEMKGLVDKTITILEKAAQEGKESAASKKRLAAACVSQNVRGA